MAIRWMALCVATALICALLRTQRPELATMLSLAAGAAVIAMLADQLRGQLPRLEIIWKGCQGADADVRSAVLRGAGVAVISDFAAQLCRDAGESALAGRVTLIARVSILALCAPMMTELIELLSRLSG